MHRSKPSLPDSYFFSLSDFRLIKGTSNQGSSRFPVNYNLPKALSWQKNLQDSRSFKLELWWNIFTEKNFLKNQWPLNFLPKYHDWNHTNPPRGKPGNEISLWPRGVLIASSRPLHKAQRRVASAQILKLCLRWAGNKKVWGISDIKIIKDSLKELHDELLN